MLGTQKSTMPLSFSNFDFLPIWQVSEPTPFIKILKISRPSKFWSQILVPNFPPFCPGKYKPGCKTENNQRTYTNKYNDCFLFLINVTESYFIATTIIHKFVSEFVKVHFKFRFLSPRHSHVVHFLHFFFFWFFNFIFVVSHDASADASSLGMKIWLNIVWFTLETAVFANILSTRLNLFQNRKWQVV